MIIVSVVGKTCSGKDYLAEYLEDKYDFQLINLGDILRSLVKEKGLEADQNNIRKIHEKVGGQTELVKLALQRVNMNKICIVGNRDAEADSYMREKFPNSKVIFVDAPAEVRFKRMLQRRRKNDPQTFNDFLKYELVEETVFHPTACRVYDRADFKVNNCGSLQELKNKVDKAISKIIQ